LNEEKEKFNFTNELITIIKNKCGSTIYDFAKIDEESRITVREALKQDPESMKVAAEFTV